MKYYHTFLHNIKCTLTYIFNKIINSCSQKPSFLLNILDFLYNYNTVLTFLQTYKILDKISYHERPLHSIACDHVPIKLGINQTLQQPFNGPFPIEVRSVLSQLGLLKISKSHKIEISSIIVLTRLHFWPHAFVVVLTGNFHFCLNFKS